MKRLKFHTGRLMPFSLASFRAKGLANTLPLGEGGIAGGGAWGIAAWGDVVGGGVVGGGAAATGGAGGVSETASAGC